ncbi:hypothetical protein BU14_0532s0009 [Porphyra umbilicalis]|uniref:Uncharacterized protein n=1 Tax=Porphyra umbilicalis TaxID=2786 RepID=A0A1X6NS87_PORUM|nr:hypothetical protein BU14_0532s0009 [Porphyra umbilicalis]|eukprot:OSX71448.1 hypothetical protein BU14_0532s0009 [Porphyra umbilicalis]
MTSRRRALRFPPSARGPASSALPPLPRTGCPGARRPVPRVTASVVSSRRRRRVHADSPAAAVAPATRDDGGAGAPHRRHRPRCRRCRRRRRWRPPRPPTTGAAPPPPPPPPRRRARVLAPLPLPVERPLCARPHARLPPPIGRLTLAQAPTCAAADAARDPGDTGTTVWDGAVVLAAAIAAHPAATVAGRVVVELGAGVGLVGVVAAKAGAAAVTLTDLPGVLPLLRRNVDANAPYGGGGGAGGRGGSGSGSGGGGGDAKPPAPPAPTVSVAECKWGDAADAAAVLSALPAPVDVVLAADLVYREEAVAPLAATLGALLPPGAAGTVWWAQEAHRPEPVAAFVDALVGGGWLLTDVPAGELDAEVVSPDIRVVRIRRPPVGGAGGGGGGPASAQEEEAPQAGGGGAP